MSVTVAALPPVRGTVPGTACFAVHGRSEPGVMPRVLALFAKRGLVPTRWHSLVEGAHRDALSIDVQIEGIGADLADYIAARLRQIPDVEVVLTSQKL